MQNARASQLPACQETTCVRNARRSPRMAVAGSHHAGLAAELREAIETDQLFLLYQPIVALATGVGIYFLFTVLWEQLPRPVQVVYRNANVPVKELMLDRDRAVDESGNQVSVFGRRGARPFTYEEMMRLLRTNDGRGDWFSVNDVPSTPPRQ